MSKKCWGSSLALSAIEFRNEMRETGKTVWQLSSQSSQSSSEKVSTFIEKIRDYCLRSEIISDFEPVDEFIKKINTDQLKQCDIIQYKCCDAIGTPYFHWALYIGDGNIIHFTNTNGGKVAKDKINYSLENYPCRVNNLRGYAQKKGYIEKSFSEVMMSALKDLDICDIKYSLINNNCGHMVTLWKYGESFNPEVAIHLQIIVPMVGAAAGGLSGLIGGGVVGYVIESYPHFCICALLGSVPGVLLGVGLGMVVGLCIGGFVGFKYTEKGRYQLHKIFINRKRQSENALMIADSPTDPEIEMRGLLMTKNDFPDTPIDGNDDSGELNGNNCEIVLYPDNDVVHVIANGNRVLVRRHHINQTYPCCGGINHKEVKNTIY